MASSKQSIKELKKKYSQEIKTAAKKQGWKSVSTFIYRVDKEFYHDTSFHIYDTNKMFGAIRLKPLFLDEIFWKIMGLNSMFDQPLSIRSNGWSAAKPIYFHSYEIILSEDIKSDVLQFYSIVNSKMAEIREKYRNVDDYIATLKLDLETNKFSVTNLLSTYVFMNDTQNINALIRHCKNNKINTGMSSDGKDFYDLVEDFIKTRGNASAK